MNTPSYPDPTATTDSIPLERIDPKFRPVFEKITSADRTALIRYFLPHNSAKALLGPTRPRIIKWYCPFACQRTFPSGHRYCVNVFSGCGHDCVYCYAAGYSVQDPAPKANFERLLLKDLEDLERFNVPPAPVHLSNSTDPFQQLERRHAHTRFALEQILKFRHRFSTVTILTKDPLWPTTVGYLDLFKALLELPPGQSSKPQFRSAAAPAFCLEVSLAFWRQEAASAYDRQAPPVEQRLAGVQRLRAAGIPVVLRIDPLFPRSPVASGCSLADFGLVEAQSIEDLDQLVRFARDQGVRHVVYSAAKIVQPRRRKICPRMRRWLLVFERMAAPARLVFRGGAWRMPPEVAEQAIIQPFLKLCAAHGVPAKHCMRNLIETP